jgi:hypothetical protein
MQKHLPELSEATLNRLHAMKRPDETIELVIRRLIDHYESNEDHQTLPQYQNPVRMICKKCKKWITQILPLHEKTVTEDVKKPQIDPDIDEILEAYSNFQENSQKEPIEFNRFSLGNVTYTKHLSVQIGLKKLPKSNWLQVIRTILTKIPQEDIPSYFHGLHIKDGKVTDKGFQFIEEINKSVQGMSANVAARAICEIAHDYNLSVEIIFQWCGVTSVEPGRRGILRINKSS